MTTAFDTALATLHADSNVSLSATYRRGGKGPATSLRVIREIIHDPFDSLGQRLQSRADTMRIQVADAATVGKDDVIEILDADGASIERVVVMFATLDAEGLTWQAHVRRM